MRPALLAAAMLLLPVEAVAGVVMAWAVVGRGL